MYTSRELVILGMGMCSVMLSGSDASSLLRTEALQLVNQTPVIRSADIVDTSGYYKTGTQLLLTAPHIFLHPNKISVPLDTITKCTVQLHTMPDSTKQLNITAILGFYTSLSTITMRDMPLSTVSFLDMHRLC